MIGKMCVLHKYVCTCVCVCVQVRTWEVKIRLQLLDSWNSKISDTGTRNHVKNKNNIIIIRNRISIITDVVKITIR